MTNQIQKPEPLPTDRFIPRAERLAWNAKMQDYVSAVRANEAVERQKQNPEPQQTTAPRTLSAADYDELCRRRWEEDQAKQKAQEAAEKAKEQARQDYLASDSDDVQILEASPFEFVLTFQHFVTRGYRLSDEGIEHFIMGCFSCKMVKAITAKKKTQ